eukprot:5098775-Ditylum_brightwellii.AAC.1
MAGHFGLCDVDWVMFNPDLLGCSFFPVRGTYASLSKASEKFRTDSQVEFKNYFGCNVRPATTGSKTLPN